MKIFYLLSLLSPFLFYSQKKVFYDSAGKLTTELEFQVKWRDNSNNLYRWDYLDNKTRICTLKEGQIEYPELDYNTIVKVLEKQLGVVFNKNAIIGLDFFYYKDICSHLRDDKWTSLELRQMKEMNEELLKNSKKKLNNNGQDLYVFYIFEKNSTVKKKNSEYFNNFILDSDNFFRDNYFKQQAMCGSSLIITPSGTLLYNGESNLGGLLERYID